MDETTRKSVSSRRTADWDAIERDFRTGTLTLREMAEKHGVVHSTIARRAEKHGWSRDLTEAIRQATNAKLVQQTVQQLCDEAHQGATQTVLAAAEINAAIIRKHRTRLDALARDADIARQKLMSLTETVTEPKDAATLVSAIESAIRSERILIEKERQTYKLDDEDTSKAIKPKRITIDFEDAEVRE